MTFERILQRPEETIMSTAERLKREGRAEGRAELLVRQLTKRFGHLPTETAARIHSATIAELDRWGEGLLDARALAEVLAAD